ncbi:type I-B CRISPR-associated protein Cas5 [Bacillaceae bacterium Marseille-Q3522]|nr:type I-B CRISPR-associated protein Cas5 [Bacillaceae bacterium Marseille-Q3522]
MDLIAFELSGKSAFFKKPDVNANTYFTYSHIHKIALFGLLGAIIGLGGHQEQSFDIRKNGHTEENQFPQFYAKLHNIKVAIVPESNRGYFSKKIQTFNNTVGYASGEAGGNLVVREQWLEKPKWTIYLANGKQNSEEIFYKLKEYLFSSKSEYIPYLGKNDHPAIIRNVREPEVKKVEKTERIDSIFYSKGVFYKKRGTTDGGNAHYFDEWVPVRLNEWFNAYEFEKITFTNRKIDSVPASINLFEIEEKVLSFI